MDAKNCDAIARLAIIGLITQIRKTIGLTFIVPMHLLSDAYYKDYVEEMVPVTALKKYLDDLESILGGGDDGFDR